MKGSVNVCPINSHCVNEPGYNFRCECDAGFRENFYDCDKLGGDCMKCVDTNECLVDHEICDLSATCINTIGSYFCQCAKDEIRLSDGRTCQALGDESLTEAQTCMLPLNSTESFRIDNPNSCYSLGEQNCQCVDDKINGINLDGTCRDEVITAEKNQENFKAFEKQDDNSCLQIRNQWASWTLFSSCSAGCGHAYKVRARKCPGYLDNQIPCSDHNGANRLGDIDPETEFDYQICEQRMCDIDDETRNHAVALMFSFNEADMLIWLKQIRDIFYYWIEEEILRMVVPSRGAIPTIEEVFDKNSEEYSKILQYNLANSSDIRAFPIQGFPIMDTNGRVLRIEFVLKIWNNNNQTWSFLDPESVVKWLLAEEKFDVSDEFGDLSKICRLDPDGNAPEDSSTWACQTRGRNGKPCSWLCTINSEASKQKMSRLRKVVRLTEFATQYKFDIDPNPGSGQSFDLLEGNFGVAIDPPPTSIFDDWRWEFLIYMTIGFNIIILIWFIFIIYKCLNISMAGDPPKNADIYYKKKNFDDFDNNNQQEKKDPNFGFSSSESDISSHSDSNDSHNDNQSTENQSPLSQRHKKKQTVYKDIVLPTISEDKNQVDNFNDYSYSDYDENAEVEDFDEFERDGNMLM